MGICHDKRTHKLAIDEKLFEFITAQLPCYSQLWPDPQPEEVSSHQSQESLVSVSALSAAWGEIQVAAEASLVVQHAHLSAGGAPVPGTEWGHGNSQPLLRVGPNASLLVSNSLVSDAGGKGLGCLGGRVTLKDINHWDWDHGIIGVSQFLVRR